MENKKSQIVIYKDQNGDIKIDVRFDGDTVWLTQKMMSLLFHVTTPTVNEHIKNIVNEGEIDISATIRKFRIVQKEGSRDVEREVEFYNLEAIISVGYRVNSQRAIQFRIWATKVLKQFAIKGYVLDKERLKNGTFLNKQFFDDLLEEIREIRTSERNFYQKITDIYATAVDYNSEDKMTKEFFATVQNKIHYAIH